MTKRKRTGRLVLLLAVAGVLAGCSSDPDPREWAGQVCAALAPWRSDIEAGTDAANAALSESSTPQDAKQELLTLLDDAANSSATARDAVVDAGTPDVDDGDLIAGRFTDALAGTARAYRSAHDNLAELDAAAPGFYDDVADVMDRLSRDYDDVPQVAGLQSKELADAFATAPECE